MRPPEYWVPGFCLLFLALPGASTSVVLRSWPFRPHRRQSLRLPFQPVVFRGSGSLLGSPQPQPLPGWVPGLQIPDATLQPLCKPFSHRDPDDPCLVPSEGLWHAQNPGAPSTLAAEPQPPAPARSHIDHILWRTHYSLQRNTHTPREDMPPNPHQDRFTRKPQAREMGESGRETSRDHTGFHLASTPSPPVSAST